MRLHVILISVRMQICKFCSALVGGGGGVKLSYFLCYACIVLFFLLKVQLKV
jgi:hypothetical protein